MTPHPTLGPLFYDPTEQVWLGFVRLPHFAAPVIPPTESLATILERLASFRHKLDVPDDTPPRTAQDDFDNWTGDERPTRAEVRGRMWARWVGKLVRARRAEGAVCVRLGAPHEEALSTAQERAVQHLLDHEAAIAAAVRAALRSSCADYGIDAASAATATIHAIQIERVGLDDLAPLRFDIDADWECEHGLAVVYHPRTGAAWSSSDGVDDLIAAACPEELPTTPTPEEQLVRAIIQRDLAQVAALRAAGVRPEPADSSALFGPIYERDVEDVRLLLAAGADPHRADAYEGTPLQAARRSLAEATLTLPRRAPWWLRTLALIPRLIHAAALRRERRKAVAILRLLAQPHAFAGGNGS